MGQAGTLLNGLVGNGLQVHHFSTSPSPVHSNQDFGATIVDAVGECARGETGKDDGMGCSDSNARLHGGGGNDRTGQVDDDGLANCDICLF